MKKKILLVATILVVVIGLCVLAGCGQSRGNMIKHKDSVYGMIYLSTGQVLTMKNGYADDLTIDRINVNGNYEPSNCRWTTMQQQRRNTRKNVFVEINDVKKVLIDWCSDYKIKYTTVLSRIYKGWEIVTAITTPSRKYKEKLL